VADGRQNLLLVFYVLHLFQTDDVFQQQNLKRPKTAAFFTLLLFVAGAVGQSSAVCNLLLAETNPAEGASACEKITHNIRTPKCQLKRLTDRLEYLKVVEREDFGLVGVHFGRTHFANK